MEEHFDHAKGNNQMIKEPQFLNIIKDNHEKLEQKIDAPMKLITNMKKMTSRQVVSNKD